LLGLEPAVDAQITQRSEEALDVRFHAEGLPVEGAGHVEAPVAAIEAPIAEGDHDVSLGHELPVEPGGPGGHGRGLLSSTDGRMDALRGSSGSKPRRVNRGSPPVAGRCHRSHLKGLVRDGIEPPTPGFSDLEHDRRNCAYSLAAEHQPQLVIVVWSDRECSRMSPSWAHFGHTA